MMISKECSSFYIIFLQTSVSNVSEQCDLILILVLACLYRFLCLFLSLKRVQNEYRYFSVIILWGGCGKGINSFLILNLYLTIFYEEENKASHILFSSTF